MHEIVVADVNVGQFAEARVHAVDVVAARDHFVDVFTRLGNGPARLHTERDFDRTAPRTPHVGKRHELFVDCQRHDPAP